MKKHNYNYSIAYHEAVSMKAKRRRQRLERNKKRIEKRIPANYFSNENAEDLPWPQGRV